MNLHDDVIYPQSLKEVVFDHYVPYCLGDSIRLVNTGNATIIKGSVASWKDDGISVPEGNPGDVVRNIAGIVLADIEPGEDGPVCVDGIVLAGADGFDSGNGVHVKATIGANGQGEVAELTENDSIIDSIGIVYVADHCHNDPNWGAAYLISLRG